jgi:oxygen-independent coproporphyrinogen-3 oxidase
LGASAIGDSWYSFAQNIKNIEEYYEMLDQNKLPLTKGHILTEEDLVVRQHILNLMCNFETAWEDQNLFFPEIPEVVAQLNEMEEDGLLIIKEHGIKVTNDGKAFIRNICMAFDLRLKRHIPEMQLFSMTV